MQIQPGRLAPPPMPATDSRDARLREVAQELEATFLAQMLTYAGLGKPLETMGGGAGEEAFSSLLTQEQARLLARRGGIGLAESLFESLKRKEAAR
ncbi:rod-binding protein [Oceanicella actignis]|uniref:rod-binding protein n=1 Tax=Oceanicella actignis TaxID=1189325 RepID=UPI0011E72EC4|nr:rod-binding protein [Oceanicella actignis]TYO89230.1 rod binding protein [Oceanicella actignis]